MKLRVKSYDDEDSEHQPLRMKFPGHGGMN